MQCGYKAFVADIDGTPTEKGGPILPKTRRALQLLHEAGLEIGLATGRPLDHRIFDRAEYWGLGFPFDVLIGMNGAELWDRHSGEIERRNMLEPQSLKEILGFMLQEDVNAVIFADGYDRVLALRNDPNLDDSVRRNHSEVEYGPPKSLWQKPACKLEFHYDLSIEESVFTLAEAHRDPRWTAIRTFPGTLEFMDPAVDKGEALKRWSMRRGISPREVIACGDMENDIGMMRAAGLGICLANGALAAKEAADEVTALPVQEDGLGIHLLKRFQAEEM